MALARESGWRRRALLPVAAVALAAPLGLLGEVVWVVRRRLPTLSGLDPSGVVAGPQSQPPIRLVVLGDSTLTGPGLRSPEEIWLRRALHELRLDQTVEVTSLAVGGSRVADVRRLIDKALAVEADVAVVAVGCNDAIHATPVRQFTRDLDLVVRRLLERFAVVAVSNVGDLGNLARVPRPLKSVLRRRSRLICRAVEAVVADHDRAVLLDVTPTNGAFRDRGVYAPDLFHPSHVGHSIWAEAAVPGLQQALEAVPAR